MLLQSILIILVIILSWFYWKQTFCNYARLLNAFPGPRSFPVAGNLIGISIKPDVLFSQVRKMCETYNQTFRTWNSIIGTLNIVTADDAEIILSQTHDINKGYLYLLFKSWLHNGLLISEGSLWHQRRKMLTPAFHFKILRKITDVFAEHSETLIKTLQNNCDKTKINVVPLMSQITLASICETSMGMKINAEDEIQNEYFDCLHKVAPFFIQRVFSPWLLPNFIYKRTKISKKFTRIINVLHKFSTKVIKEREENFHEDDEKIFDENENEESDININKKLAFLDLLISRKRRGDIDDHGIREEVDTFIFAGHDTTAVAACFALMLLANHKDIQEKARNEIDEIFEDPKRRITYQDLLNMKYLDRCIKETLRLYPSVPTISRFLEKDTKLTHHTVPANTTVFIHIYNVHRDPKNFPDPEKFDPDRFLPENCKGRNSFAYIPFSAGPRNCIGQKFATLELKTILTSILRNFILEPVDSAKDVILMVDLVLRMKGPLYVRFIPRY